MTAPVSPSQPMDKTLHEVVAGIVDPEAKFIDLDGVQWSKFIIQQRELAYRKADSILALMPSHASLLSRLATAEEALRNIATEPTQRGNAAVHYGRWDEYARQLIEIARAALSAVTGEGGK